MKGTTGRLLGPAPAGQSPSAAKRVGGFYDKSNQDLPISKKVVSFKHKKVK